MIKITQLVTSFTARVYRVECFLDTDKSISDIGYEQQSIFWWRGKLLYINWKESYQLTYLLM